MQRDIGKKRHINDYVRKIVFCLVREEEPLLKNNLYATKCILEKFYENIISSN